ncbi:hypothetical protein C8J57DRAFT_1248065 [Mycena rebaudengoi]|nr:hypothetical protein C8J57DRAFT_1248065 [Mycena rebaudengoi]
MVFLGVLLEDFEDKMSFNEASLEFDTEALLKYYEAHLIRDRLHALQRYQWKGQKGGYGNWKWMLGQMKASRTLPDSIPLLMTHAGDRVQWFRAEAEMQRWQEQWEQKLPLDSPSAAAYACQKAAMYTRRKVEAEKNIKDVGHEELLGEMANVVAFVESERKKARKFIEAALACIS